MSELQQINGKVTLTEVHHLLEMAVEEFARITCSAPKVVAQIVQNIYGRFDNALCHVYHAEASFDAEEKSIHLHEAKADIFFQFTSLELLVKSKSMTVKQAESILKLLMKAHEEISKWLASIVRKQGSN